MAKAKASNADIILVTSRLNDAILITRELVKQRWTPQGILSMGPGWYEDQYLKILGKLSDGPMGLNPWQDPNKRLTPVLEAELAKAYPGVNLNANHVFTFEALLVAADAYKRAGSTDPNALADAIRTTNITDNVSIGRRHPIQREGPKRQSQEWCHAEPRRKTRNVGSKGCRKCKTGVADDVVPQPRLGFAVPLRIRPDGVPRLILVPNRVDRRTLEGQQLVDELTAFGEHVSIPIGYRTAFIRAFSSGFAVSQWAGEPAHGPKSVRSPISLKGSFTSTPAETR